MNATKTLGHLAERRGAKWALCVGALLCGLGSGDAHGAISAAKCQVDAIHVVKEGDGTIPENLKFVEAELKDDQFAAWKGFRLIDSRELLPKLEKPSEARMKTGHRVRLSLLGDAPDTGSGARLMLKAMLTARGGDKPLLDTNYAIKDKGLLLIGGVTHEGGRLFFALRCASVASK